VGGFAARFTGSQDIFGDGGKPACSSINFITAHDGFTLYDLYSYEQKYNKANGEDNLDGTDNNNAFNCGIEGATVDAGVLELRRRMVMNAMCTLLMSRGTPMLLSGDEVMRTQQGNNNAYCQDNEISWFPLNLTEQNHNTLSFCRGLIALRKRLTTSRQCSFFTGRGVEGTDGPDISWYGAELDPPNWEDESNRLLCCEITLPGEHQEQKGNAYLFLIFNMGEKEKVVRLPEHAGFKWYRLCDTGLRTTPVLIIEDGTYMLHPEDNYLSGARTVTILMGMIE